MRRMSFIRDLLGFVVGVFAGMFVRYGKSVISTQSGSGTTKDPYTDRLAVGPLDNIPSRLLYARQQVAGYLHSSFPYLSTCGRCKFPWSIVRGHDTNYDVGWSCFPLCEDCWYELSTASDRMPYYMELVDEWARDMTVEETSRRRKLISSAVLQGE